MGEQPDDADRVEAEARELAGIRRQLRRLITSRQQAPLSPADRAEFEQLSRREQELLARRDAAE